MRGSIIAIVLGVAIVCPTAGCTSPANQTEAASEEASAPASPRRMPSLLGLSIDDAATQLSGSEPSITVELPERRLTADTAGRAARGRKGRTVPVVLPKVAAGYDSAPGWAQLVVGQSPAPGALLSAGESVVLEAGRHGGGDPTRPWVWEHPLAVKKQGAGGCLERCHTAKSCSDCHTQMLPEDK